MQRYKLDLLLLINSKVIDLAKDSEILYSGSSHDQLIALDCYVKVLTLIFKELEHIK